MISYTLLNQDDLSFLKAIVHLFPETKYLLSLHQSTAETNVFPKTSLSSHIFEGKNILDSTEFDRAAVGVLCFKYVMTNNYSAFTACQKEPNKLSKETFQKIRTFTTRIIQTESDLNTALYSIFCNDLGKTKKPTEIYAQETGHSNADHDAIFSYLLSHRSDLFSGFLSLPTKSRQTIQEGLSTCFNLGQFVQGENLPVHIDPLTSLSPKSRDLFILHAFYDIAGAAGHIRQDGSLVMTESTCRSFLCAVQHLLADPSTAYYDYLSDRGKQLGLDISSKEGFALSRITALSRVLSDADFIPLKEAFNQLPVNVRTILVKELNISGTGKKEPCGILLYYAPAFINNAQRFFLNQLPQHATTEEKKQAQKTAYRLALTALAEIYQSVRINLRHHPNKDVITVDLNTLSKKMMDDAYLVTQKYIETQIDFDHHFGYAVFKDPPQIEPEHYPQDKNITRLIPNGRTAYIGIGGGSDVIQATQIAQISKKPIACIISVRSAKTQSQSDHQQKIGVQRTVQNHGGEIVQNVYRILPETTGNGRFLENIPTKEGLPVYLILDASNRQLAHQIESAIQDAGGADNIVCVDTGGDCLYSTQKSDSSQKATPDQDYATLKAVSCLSPYHKISLVLATGVDAPEYASDILTQAQARFIHLTPQQKNTILHNYKKWGMDGSTQSVIGKTPLALQKALTGETGLTTLELPQKVITDDNNPWDPFVIITKSMSSVVAMSLDKHFNAITQTHKKQISRCINHTTKQKRENQKE